jgi:hypothetical protein
MNRRDEDLLARQLHGMDAPPNGSLAGVAVAVFLVGLLVGGMVLAPPAHSLNGASHATQGVLATVSDTAPIRR